ncbi:hypothetical protein DOTSEDRAFT_133423 [Dothistroma septosporum NZE10]|uniref:Aspartate aminotransferase n=1 Tax=Dothistroma septosporum (strain NZE10 / CBS 128990) TaxID=675120 RepID=N1PL66_DOTSN|nr:hypothetical protein DOTSEDRAFT_133423 [Dothistroma septosporum NZE10]
MATSIDQAVASQPSFATGSKTTGLKESPLTNVRQAPKDPMFGLSAAYRADIFDRKVDLGVGAYRDDHAKPWVLPVVRKAKEMLHHNTDLNHEYQPIAGFPEYTEASQRLVLGNRSKAIREQRAVTVQTLSGTGALSLGARFLAAYYPHSSSKRVWVSDPPYVNHIPIMKDAGLETGIYPYYTARTRSLNFAEWLAKLRQIPLESIILLHACAHNPTGVDPTHRQWEQIAGVMKERRHLPFFDSAYQGFASGNLDDDAWAIRHFVEQGFDTILIAQSYAKNFGLYGERAGNLHVVTRNADLSQRILSQLTRLQRVSISTPPAFGARVVSTVLNDPRLFAEWQDDLRTMSGRIVEMRQTLRTRIEQLGTPGTWQHITDQSGMFCYSGLTPEQVAVLREVYHIYLTSDGRTSISGLNGQNVGYVAQAIKEVVSGGRVKL